MKIIQVATLITPDGAYGGPVRVAANQTRALLEAGHDVVLAAGARGFSGILPETFDGVPVKLFPATILPKLGFAGTNSPALLRWLRREVREADVVHVHMGRDFVTLPAAHIAASNRTPLILQTHGMIRPSSHALAKPVDTFWTRPALRRASRTLFLTPNERTALEELEPSLTHLQELHNGVPLPGATGTASNGIEVLFLARIHERKRPRVFIEMAKMLHPRFPEARFVLVGPDEGEGPSVQASIAASGMENVLRWEGPVEPHQSAERIGRSSIYVLPSVDEAFPMTVLEAMSLGKPVVITNTCGLADAVSKAAAGAIAGQTVESLVTAVATLLESDRKRKEAADNARRLARETFGMEGIVRQLTDMYQEVSQQNVS